MMEGSITYQEIITQPQALAASLKAVEEQTDDLLQLWRRGYDRVIFTGCGSTYYLSLSAAYGFQKLNHVFSSGIPGGELFLSPHLFSPLQALQRVLLVAVSRSGATTETVRAVEHFKDSGAGSVVTITCEPTSPLNKLGDINIVIPEAREKSVAQTRAFVAMQMATLTMAVLIAGETNLKNQLHKMPELSADLLDKHHDSMEKLGSDLSLDRIYFLGSGLCYGLACEGSLKMKEMTLTHTEPFHFLEFRHGPKSMLTDSTLVVGLHSVESQIFEMDVLIESQQYGSRILSLGDAEPSTRYDNSVVFSSGCDQIAHSLLYLPPIQLLALARARAKGLNPDQPHNLDAVVKLENLRAP
jgi:glucosamine--fructose-6-phosphate aminotransferase (isomerizing)